MTTSKSSIVLITGANQGIGFETARLLAKQNPDYHILMGSRDATRGEAAASTLEKEGLSVEPITIDVTDDASIIAAAELVARNSSPGSRSIRSVLQKSYDVNVFGAMQTFHAFEALLSTAAVPRVVFLSSDLGSFGKAESLQPGLYPIYRSTKSAMNMLVITYAQAYKERGWKVNACCPGFVATNLNNFAGTGGRPESGAVNAVRLATLGKDGESGTLTDSNGVIPW